MNDPRDLERLCVDTLRFLAADAVQKADSGHPGAPMGMAPMAFALWDSFLKHNPTNPAWVDRDRFVLSAGHASSLLYGLLHLTGYDLPMEQLQRFRQWGSATPGHPERGDTPGVEVTTGPLGQGLSHAVGMAAAERFLAARYNRPGHEIVDHFTYVIVSDGDMQEGVTGEASSLAGTWKLGKLVVLYDDNGIQIDGPTSKCFTEDVCRRYEAYGWHVQGPIDGFDLAAVRSAVAAARAEVGRPSFIACRTIIGYGAPAQGTEKVHGSPLGPAGVLAAKEKLGWPSKEPFHVPAEVREHMVRAVERGRQAEASWRARFEAYRAAQPDLARRFELEQRGELPEGWDAGLEALFPAETKPQATRVSSGVVINHLASRLENLWGGSADLAASTKTLQKGRPDFAIKDYAGTNVNFGVREHAMGSIAGGAGLHGGVIPYTATFLCFSDYMRPPMRLACFMKQRVIYVFTHDSIGLGEDGPTHQPVEQLMALRVIPNLTLLRPADATETAEAWRVALTTTTGPTVLVFTRQDLPVLDRAKYAPASGVAKGAYVLWESAPKKEPALILMGSGSELPIALAAGQQLGAGGRAVRVVSIPSFELFQRQPQAYRDAVLPPAVTARVAVEAGVTVGWERWVGDRGAVVGMAGYGASAPSEVLYEKFGITAAGVVAAAEKLLR